MPREGCEESLAREQEQYLYFSKERILRWMRWIRRNKDLHPELEAYEQLHKETRRWAWLRQRLRKSS